MTAQEREDARLRIEEWRYRCYALALFGLSAAVCYLGMQGVF